MLYQKLGNAMAIRMYGNAICLCIRILSSRFENLKFVVEININIILFRKLFLIIFRFKIN